MSDSSTCGRMIDHRPWIGPDFRSAPREQQIAIVGYSHYSDESDDEGATEKCISCVINGERMPFFTKIAGYFGCDAPAFWSRVAFFNFIPCFVGGSNELYKRGSSEQTEAGKRRVLRLLAEIKPQKVFVFSKKAWWDFPESIESKAGLEPHEPSGWVTYPAGDGRIALAVGLQHPQWAKSDIQTAAVRSILTAPFSDVASDT